MGGLRRLTGGWVSGSLRFGKLCLVFFYDGKLTMIATYRTMLGISLSFVASNGPINCPSAPPSGFARLATAVALVRPRSENQISLYLVGAVKTNGCANPIKICPNIATPKMPPFAFVPPYRIQFPHRSRTAAVIIDGLGPPLFKVHMTKLCSMFTERKRKSGYRGLFLSLGCICRLRVVLRRDEEGNLAKEQRKINNWLGYELTVSQRQKRRGKPC